MASKGQHREGSWIDTVSLGFALFYVESSTNPTKSFFWFARNGKHIPWMLAEDETIKVTKKNTIVIHLIC